MPGMFHDGVILRPCDQESVKRVFEQQSDGSILYSSLRPHAKVEEIRLFDVPSRKDVLIYVHNNPAEIVNASINPDRNVVAFTTLRRKISRAERGERKAPFQSEFSEDSDSGSDDTFKSFAPLSDAASWVFTSDENGKSASDGLQNSGAESRSEDIDHLVKGRYISYLADVHPLSWIKKFDVRRGLYQKVIFSNCNISKKEKGALFKENRLLFIMHQKSIGLYAVTLNSQSKLELSGSHLESFHGSQAPRVEIFSRPKSTMIVQRPFWSQWDSASQRLFYIVVVKSRQRSGEPTSTPFQLTLHCIQFGEAFLQRRIFSCQINLGIPDSVLLDRSSGYDIVDVDSAVSSPELNMQVLTLKNGTVCLAWQTSNFSNDESLYKIAILDKDITLDCSSANIKVRPRADGAILRLSFVACGDNVLICGASTLTHLIAVDCISGDKDRFFGHCHYLADSCELSFVSAFRQLPFPMPDHCLDSDIDETNDRCFVFDEHTKSISVIHIDRRKLGRQFFSKETTMENKLALCRFGCIAFREQSSGFTLLKEMLLSLLSNDMILHGDKYIGTLLFHMVANDVYWRCPADTCRFLRSLLPVAVPILTPESRNFILSLNSSCIKGDLALQVSQSLKLAESSYSSCQSMVLTFKCGAYTPYDVHSIADELFLLQENSSKKHLLDQKSRLKERLNSIYENEIVKPSGGLVGEEENILECFSSPEKDHFQENVMALTYEKLCDHLKRFLDDDANVIRYIARSFVTAQRRVVIHLITMLIMVTGVEQHDKNLFLPVWKEERKLLQLLKRIFSSCLSINFPLPTGFQTFLTCLVFRCCLTTHLATGGDQEAYYDDDEESISSGETQCSIRSLQNYNKKDIEEFSFEFLQMVDCKLVQLTGEFVARLLEEMPNHDDFGPFINQILLRANIPSRAMSDGILQVWKHPYAAILSAKMQMKRLSQISSYTFVGDTNSDGGKRGFIVRQSSGFQPLDTFLNHVRSQCETHDMDSRSVEEATLQGVVSRHGRDSLRDISF